MTSKQEPLVPPPPPPLRVGNRMSWDYFSALSTQEPLPPPSAPLPSTIDNERIPSSLVEIAPFLRVANEVEPSNPRVAYICRFYAFEKCTKLDPNSSGRGVRQFKTTLLHRLERENDTSLIGRQQHSDVVEIKRFYRNYYSKYLQALQNGADKADRNLVDAQLKQDYETASILYELISNTYDRAQAVENEEEVAIHVDE